MKRNNNEICLIANEKSPSGDELLEKGVPISTWTMQIVQDCQERPRQNGGPACLPECRDSCPFYKLN